jgi:hypothetical protein
MLVHKPLYLHLKITYSYYGNFCDRWQNRQRKIGYPIGSGEVEIAHKSIPQKRMKIPGACWHPSSINPILSLRILRANDWWDDFWNNRNNEMLLAA